MTITIKYAVTTPDDTTANDFALALASLAEAVTGKMAGYAEGLLADRPAATPTNVGLIFRCVDSTVAGGIFISNGSIWIRLTASPWVTWSPSVVMTDGGGGVISGVNYFPSATVAQYRVNTNDTIEVYIEETVRLQGTQKFLGLLYSAPVAAARKTVLKGDAMNDVARVFVGDEASFGNVLSIYPSFGYNVTSRFTDPLSHPGEWLTDNVPRGLHINGVYSV